MNKSCRVTGCSNSWFLFLQLEAYCSLLGCILKSREELDFLTRLRLIREISVRDTCGIGASFAPYTEKKK